MSVAVKNGSGVTEQAVQGSSAAVMLWDGNGNALTYKNGQDPVTIPQGIIVGAMNDGIYRFNRADRFGSQAIASHNPMLSPDFEGTTLNASQFVASNTTFVPAQTTGAYSFNPTNLTTANAVAILMSLKRFKKMQRAPLQGKFRLRNQLVGNSVAEWGFGAPAGTALNTVGAYFKVTGGGAMVGIVSFNSSEIPAPLFAPNGAAFAYGDLEIGAFYTYDVLVDDDEATFIVQDTETEVILASGTLRLPRNQLRLVTDSHLSTFVRVFNGGVAPAQSPVLILTDVQVTALDAVLGKPWPHILASSGFGSANNPLTGAQLAQFANSAVPANAVLSNTAASYATLGGLFAIAAVAGAVTDYALFVFTVPAPYQLVITDINIDTYNDGAAVATSASNLIWGVGLNGSSANLSTGGFVRRALGNQSFAIGAGIGAVASPVTRRFDSPIVVESGRSFAVILRLPIGTATASQVLRGSVDISGYFE